MWRKQSEIKSAPMTAVSSHPRPKAAHGFFFLLFSAKSKLKTESAFGVGFVFLSLLLFFFKAGWSPPLPPAELATNQQNNFAAVTAALMCPLWGSPRRNRSVFLRSRHS